MVVTESTDSGTWWKGYLQDDPQSTVGDFPFNYVEDVDEAVRAQLAIEMSHGTVTSSQVHFANN